MTYKNNQQNSSQSTEQYNRQNDNGKGIVNQRQDRGDNRRSQSDRDDSANRNE